MRGIILAGGTGSRLFPLTKTISKQLLPVYDKPMVYYPLATLMLAGITEILIITTPQDQYLFQQLLADGNQLGITIDYQIQVEPAGIAQAFLIAKNFIDAESVALILGDNIFYGAGLGNKLARLVNIKGGGIFAYQVRYPQAYGVVEFDVHQRVISIVEKPAQPRSNFVVPGLYFYDNQVVKFAEQLVPSARGELEISDINNMYLRQNKLGVEILPRATAWFDAGTPDSLLEAASYVRTIEQRQGLKIGAIEEIAWRKNYISDTQLEKLAFLNPNSQYSNYLLRVLTAGKNLVSKGINGNETV